MIVAVVVVTILLVAIGWQDLGVVASGLALGGCVLVLATAAVLPEWWPVAVSAMAIVDIVIVLKVFGGDIEIR
jgi:hypothetical protein